MNRTISVLLFLLSCLALSGCYAERTALKPQMSVSSIDIDRYSGRWYEIARFDAFFQKDCTGVTAEYKKISPSQISVLNSCHLKSLDGHLKTAHGVARIPNSDHPAQLKVRFDQFPANLFEGDYWVIALDNKNYQWSVVSEPKGKYLWILSRTKTMDSALYNRIIDDLNSKGIQTKFLMKTVQ